MPYYIGDVIRDDRRLIARTPEKFRESGIEVRLNTRVDDVDGDEKVVRLSDGTLLAYDVLVLGTGTTPFVPPVPGVDLDGVFTLKKLTDALRIKAYLKDRNCRKALIVGAGFIGMEMAEALRRLGIETEIVHRGTTPVNRWDPDLSGMVLEELNRRGVPFHTKTEIRSVERGREHLLRLVTNRGELEADMILLALGVRPNVRLAGELGLQIGSTGAIRVNFSQRTSREDIYAVGDCCEVFHRVSRRWAYLPLGDIANKQGRVAGRNIAGRPLSFPGVVGAQSFGFFDMELAAAGITEREALESGYHPVSGITWGNALAGPMPDQKKIGLKLIADRSTGRLLGAQAVGAKGAVSRINALSVALWSGLGVDEIAYLDLAYAPPFGGAWDAIHNAAQALARKL